LGLHPFSDFLKEAKMFRKPAAFLFSGEEAPNVVDSFD
jgi:hypothetical protein